MMLLRDVGVGGELRTRYASYATQPAVSSGVGTGL